jgi:hypothetical protein
MKTGWLPPDNGCHDTSDAAKFDVEHEICRFASKAPTLNDIVPAGLIEIRIKRSFLPTST